MLNKGTGSAAAGRNTFNKLGPPTTVPTYAPPTPAPAPRTARQPLAPPPQNRQAATAQALRGRALTPPPGVPAYTPPEPSGPQFGEQGWTNPHVDVNRNANGYSRFDVNAGPGIGLEQATTYDDGARIYDTYAKLKRGQPGFTHSQNASDYLRSEYGVTNDTAENWHKFGAMDYAMTLAQRKNQRPKRKFGVGNALGLFGGLALTAAGAPFAAKAAYSAANHLAN